MRLSLQDLTWYSMVLSVNLGSILVIHNTYTCTGIWTSKLQLLSSNILFQGHIPVLGQLHLKVCIYIYLNIYMLSLTKISTLSDYWDKWPWMTCGLIGECILIKGLAGVPSVPILEACQNWNTFHVSCWYIWFNNYQI